MSKVDGKLTAVLVFFAVIFSAATVYLFKHPSDGNYLAFLGAFGVMGTIMHWICTYDDKHPDERKDS